MWVKPVRNPSVSIACNPSLLCAPAPGITLEQKKALTAELLRSGVTIQEINAKRRELSAVKGGKLAEACAPAHLITLIISDVPGNDPSVVASGPTVVDAASAREADVRILATSDDALQAAALRALDLELPGATGRARHEHRRRVEVVVETNAGERLVDTP